MLDLNNALMATFRFAAGQKSISADDLVVFAEIVYSFLVQTLVRYLYNANGNIQMMLNKSGGC